MAIWFKTHLRRISVRANRIRRVAQSILVQAGHPTAQLSLSLVGKTRMRSLNRKYRGRDYPTDVLAFPMGSMAEQTDEDGIFVAEVTALPGCISQGNTRKEVLRNIQEAITAYLESLKAHNEPIPPSINEEVVEVAV